jgi:hypothetical protein
MFLRFCCAVQYRGPGDRLAALPRVLPVLAILVQVDSNQNCSSHLGQRKKEGEIETQTETERLRRRDLKRANVELRSRSEFPLRHRS